MQLAGAVGIYRRVVGKSLPIVIIIPAIRIRAIDDYLRCAGLATIDCHAGHVGHHDYIIQDVAALHRAIVKGEALIKFRKPGGIPVMIQTPGDNAMRGVGNGIVVLGNSIRVNITRTGDIDCDSVACAVQAGQLIIAAKNVEGVSAVFYLPTAANEVFG